MKESLDNGACLIIDDELTLKELQDLAKHAKKYNEDKDNKIKS